MKSKISFFNKTIYLKNITLFWPIWVIYLVYLLITGPAILALEFSTYYLNKIGTDAYQLITNYFDPRGGVITSFIMAIIVAMALYNYLYVPKSANMIHALPVSRLEMFVTNLCSGFSFLFVPQILTFLVSVFVCLGYGVTGIEYIGIWLLINMGVSFFFYSTAVFCAFLTGQLFSLPLYYIALHFLYEFIQVIVGMVMGFCGFGIDYYSMGELMKWQGLSPVVYLFNNVWFDVDYYENRVTGDMSCVGINVEGWENVIWYIIPAILFIVIAYWFYHRRHIEHAGDWITVSWVKPVFRWGIGLTCGYFFGIGISAILEEFNINLSAPFIFLFIALMGIVFFFISEMLLQKSFKIFKKKCIAEMGIFTGFLLVSYVGILLGINYMERYIPDKDEVQYAIIDNYDYPITMEGEKVSQILEIHQTIIEHREELEDYDWRYDESLYVEITYYLKNDKVIRRQYDLLLTDTSKELNTTIIGLEEEPENYLNYLFGKPYGEAKVLGGNVEWYDPISEFGYENFEVNQSQAQKLYEAAIKDAETGALQKYNLSNYQEEFLEAEKYEDGEYVIEEAVVEEESNTVHINLYVQMNAWQQQKTQEQWSLDGYYNYDFNEYTSETWFYVGKDCTNLVQAILDLGVADSAEELFGQQVEE